MLRSVGFVTHFLRTCYSCGLSSTSDDAVSVRFHAYGLKFQCNFCHSSYRYCRDNVPGWDRKTPEEKNQWILANRKTDGRRGQKRVLQTISSVEVSDFRGQEGETEYLNEIRPVARLVCCVL